MARLLEGFILFFTAEQTDIGRLLPVVATTWLPSEAELRLRPKLRGSVLVAHLLGVFPAFVAASLR